MIAVLAVAGGIAGGLLVVLALALCRAAALGDAQLAHLDDVPLRERVS